MKKNTTQNIKCEIICKKYNKEGKDKMRTNLKKCDYLVQGVVKWKNKIKSGKNIFDKKKRFGVRYIKKCVIKDCHFSTPFVYVQKSYFLKQVSRKFCIKK